MHGRAGGDGRRGGAEEETVRVGEQKGRGEQKGGEGKHRTWQRSLGQKKREGE